MKKLFDIELAGWFLNKQSDAFIAASVNAAYVYEVTKETEKAIQISITKKDAVLPRGEWKMWMPKSVILNLNEVLA